MRSLLRHRIAPPLLGFLLGLVASAGVGCAPLVVCRTETEIRPNHACRRQVLLVGTPSKRVPNQRIKLQDYLTFPEAELYEKFVLTPAKVMFTGTFPGPERVPVDFIKTTPQTDRGARNQVLFRSIDLVLIEVMEFEERIDDIVDRADGEKALQELIGVFLDAVLNALHDRYAADYDLQRLDAYLRQEFPQVVTRLYGALWELRRARRGGVALLTESAEWRECLTRELARLGVAPAASSEDAQAAGLQEVFTRFLDAKLPELTTPRRPDIAPLRGSMVKDREGRAELFAALQESIKQRHGSIPAFSAKIEPLLPRAFGAFLINQVSLLPLNPEFEFFYRLALPGHVVQTNGLRDLDGRILWTFTDREVALSGYAMWARSLVLRSEAVAALGLQDFPGHIHSVERLFQLLRAPEDGAFSERLIQVLRASIAAHSLRPLEGLAAGAAGTDPAPTPQDVRAAAQLLEFLNTYRKPQPPAPDGTEEPLHEEDPDLPPQDPEPPAPREKPLPAPDTE